MSRKSVPVALMLALVATLAPVAASLFLAYEQSREDELSQVMALASEVLRRGNESSRQIIEAIDELNAQPGGAPCSKDNRLLMERIDLRSTYLQAVGHVENNQLDCYSLGELPAPYPLGNPDYVSALGYATRLGVELPPGSGQRYVVSERNGFAAIIHPERSLDVFVDQTDISLGSFSYSAGRALLQRGHFDTAWPARLGENSQVAFFDEAYVVALKRSDVGDFAAFAAVPILRWQQQMQRLTIRLVPFGLGAGLLLAYLLRRLLKQQSSLPAQVRQGLRRHEFFLLYQPIVALQNGELVGAEALIRWRRADGELVRPDLFIPIAEESGLIRQITGYVMQRAADDMRAVFAAHPSFHVAINVSAQDLEARDLQEAALRLAKDAGGQPGNIVLEATERGFLNAELVMARVAALRALGCLIAIDDFGTGYSSLSYLEKFEFDCLKIDKSFVDTIGTDAATSRVVSHIIGMAKSLKVDMVAEGVETADQASFLREHGVQFAQGWHFGRPMPVAQLLTLLTEQAQQQPSAA